MRRFSILIATVLLAFAANIYFGAVDIPFAEINRILLHGGESGDATSFIVLNSRLPQAVTALLAGAALAVTGLMLQTSFRNPLAGPQILGISSGASLGVAVVMLFFGGTFAMGTMSLSGNAAAVTGALIGALAVMGVLIFFSMRIRSRLMLLITGMMTGYLTSSVVTLLSSLSNAQSVQGYVMWGMGTFAGVSMDVLPQFSVVVAVGLLAALTLAKPLNVLLLGDEYAANLGVNIKSVRNRLLLITGVIVAVVTAFCGPISFIGLAMPHIARYIFHTDDHFTLMPATMLCGATSALICNVISTLPDNTVIPLNALTPIFGVPVILAVILSSKN